MDYTRNTNAEELAGREYNPERDAVLSIVGVIKTWGAANNRVLNQSDIAIKLGTTAEQLSRAVNHGAVTIPTLRRWVTAWNEAHDEDVALVLVLDGSKITVERKVDRKLYPRVS